MIFYTLTLIGAAVFACGGALAAIKNKMDLVGVTLMAFIVGTGGGTLRSLFLGQGPVFWATQPIYATITILIGILTFTGVFLLKKAIPNFSSKYSAILNNILLIADAVGLGVFSVAGTQIALDAGMSIEIAIIIGMFNAVGGVILRDVLCNEDQLLFKCDVYAAAALLGSISYIVLLNTTTIDVAVFLSVMLVFIIRVAAIFLKIKLPVIG